MCIGQFPFTSNSFGSVVRDYDNHDNGKIWFQRGIFPGRYSPLSYIVLFTLFLELIYMLDLTKSKLAVQAFN